MKYDAIIIGSGAGGSAAAYHLTQTGKQVLLLEKGEQLPSDGSTLDVEKVLRHGTFLNDEPWWDREGNIVVPEEHFNLGGKTRWYGAALLRFSPGEFRADPSRGFLAWPIGYEDLEPYYEEAERLLDLRTFAVEPGLQRLVAGLKSTDVRWASQPLPLGLSGDILQHRAEAAHFDGFASVEGLKSDAQNRFLDLVRRQPNLEIMTGRPVRALLPAASDPRTVIGVECEDGSRYYGDSVLLAAGALHSPRLLQSYCEVTGLAARLPAYRNIGRHYKSHVLTAMLAVAMRKVPDLLSKTVLLTHASFPYSSVQTLGGRLAEEIVNIQAPRWLPRALSRPLGQRAIGLFLQTEDGSHPDNRVVAATGWPVRPQIDYSLARLPHARTEHRSLVRTLRMQLLRLGYLPAVRPIPLSGTAHACGTLVSGVDPHSSVVDGEGRMHGMENLYVVDGSALPRSSRVNPALTIYAWGLRVASRLARAPLERSSAVLHT
ncbi:MAG TPA: FAD-dependent oxidoreductase [Burkholderiales bacterium]|nr:FAD-dependent oxidoreductase [Burkholderiales bacterium]